MALDMTKAIAEMDQGQALILDTFPPLLWGLFERLRKEGFGDNEAFILTRDYLKCTLRGPREKDGE